MSGGPLKGKTSVRGKVWMTIGGGTKSVTGVVQWNQCPTHDVHTADVASVFLHFHLFITIQIGFNVNQQFCSETKLMTNLAAFDQRFQA